MRSIPGLDGNITPAMIPVGAEMVGHAPGELRLDPPAIVLGVLRDGVTSAMLLEDPHLRQGDVLITLAARPASS